MTQYLALRGRVLTGGILSNGFWNTSGCQQSLGVVNRNDVFDNVQDAEARASEQRRIYNAKKSSRRFNRDSADADKYLGTDYTSMYKETT